MKKLFFSLLLTLSLGFLVVTILGNSMQVISNIVMPSERCIIIDAGHGGFDGGAVSADGCYEKNLNLEFSKKLDEILTVNGYKTIMIRNEDVSVNSKDDNYSAKKSDIYNRLKVGQKYPQAIFISIHQNSFRQKKSCGSQVFYGAKNKESEHLAKIIRENIHEKIQKENEREIKKADSNLYIMKNTENVAVLLECGFLTNPEELKLLKNPNYQQDLCFTVFLAIEQYFNETEET
ncbi:MAG: N-acetylmuramoyl-L-alanine amidase [Oscillospiraceae bacterium]